MGVIFLKWKRLLFDIFRAIEGFPYTCLLQYSLANDLVTVVPFLLNMFNRKVNGFEGISFCLCTRLCPGNLHNYPLANGTLKRSGELGMRPSQPDAL